MNQKEIIDMNKENVYTRKSKNSYGFAYFAKKILKRASL